MDDTDSTMAQFRITTEEMGISLLFCNFLSLHINKKIMNYGFERKKKTKFY